VARGPRVAGAGLIVLPIAAAQLGILSGGGDLVYFLIFTPI